MPAPSYTYTLANSTTADASQVMQNYNDILNGVIDGTKDLNIAALTCAGAVTMNGSVTLGNSSIDTFTPTASLGASIVPATADAYDLGSSLLPMRTGYYQSGIQVKTPSVNYAALSSVGVLSFVGSVTPGWMSNVGFEAAQTSVANDSIRITSADGSDFSSTNPGYVCLPSTSAIGGLAVFRITSNVTINLTGAHWGLGTLGDFTDVELCVYAINDAGALKWGVSNTGNYKTITTALSSQTQTDINLRTEMLVNSTLTGTSPCVRAGWFLADFDDTGGTSEDLWVVQTGVGEINVGIPLRDVTEPELYTLTASGLGTLATQTVYWSRVGGDRLLVSGRVTAGTIPSTEVRFGLPTGRVVASPTSSPISPMPVPGRWFRDSASVTAIKAGPILAVTGNTYVGIGWDDYTNGNTPILARSSSIFNNGEILVFNFEVRTLGWSMN